MVRQRNLLVVESDRFEATQHQRVKRLALAHDAEAH
jgi:hypothetical protein